MDVGSLDEGWDPRLRDIGGPALPRLLVGTVTADMFPTYFFTLPSSPLTPYTPSIPVTMSNT